MTEQNMIGCFEQGVIRLIRAGRVFYKTDKFNCQWERVVDAISKGTFMLPAARGCCPPEAHAWADMIEFERNGVIEWSGYCMKPFTIDGAMQIEAYDLLHGYQSRIVRTGINVVGVDLTDIAAMVLTSADGDDPVPVVPVLNASGVLGDRIVTTAEYRIAWDVLLNDLLKIGLDMSMVGTLLYVGPLEDRGLKPLKLNERMIRGVPTVGEDGPAYANRIIAKGGNGLVSIYPPGPAVAVPPFPLVEAVVDANDSLDQVTLDLLAKQHYDLRSAVPRFVAFEQGVSLTEDTPYPLRALIPGRLAQVKLDHECQPIDEGMRLEKVIYQLSGGREEIKIQMVPMGLVSAGVAA